MRSIRRNRQNHLQAKAKVNIPLEKKNIYSSTRHGQSRVGTKTENSAAVEDFKVLLHQNQKLCRSRNIRSFVAPSSKMQMQVLRKLAGKKREFL